MKLRHWLSSSAIGALIVAGAAAWADPPERVGRVAYIRGDVSVQQTDQDDWSPASRNYPVTQGEAIWTEQGANTELQIGPVEVFLDGETEVDVDQLDYGVMQLSLPEGAIHVEMARVPDGGVRIETPQGEVRLTQPGAYRIDAGASEENDPDSLMVTVLSGHAEIAGPGVLVPIQRGQMGTVENGYRVSISDGGPNDLDDFARQQLAQGHYNDAPVYVSDEYTGYEDLDAYGDWDDTPDYGRVWYPRGVAVDWAPYHYGHWANVAPWGWTWIDDAQWGFTPFHYGRWTQVRGRWGWAPGERVVRPVYAPALVSFIGGGPGVGVGISVGWIPLAPREVYRPYYSVSTTYVRNINITTVDRRVVNTLTVENIHRGADNFQYHNDHARTFVRQEDFSRAAPVQRAAIKGGPPQAGGHGPQPFDISKVKAAPQARGGGPGGDHNGGPHGDGRGNQRHIAMKAPTANAVPNKPTTPNAVQPGGQRQTMQRGNWNGGAHADQHGGPRNDVRSGQTGGPTSGAQGGAPRGPSNPAAIGANATSVTPQQPNTNGSGQRGPQGRHARDFGQGNPNGGNPAGNPNGGVNGSVNGGRFDRSGSDNRSNAGINSGAPNNPQAGGDLNRFRRSGQPNGAPTAPVAPQAPQVQVAPQAQQAPQTDHRFDGGGGRRPGQPGGGQPNAVQANGGSPGDAGGRFGRRGGQPQGGTPTPQSQSQSQAPAHVAASRPPAPQPQAQPQPPHPQGGNGGGQHQGGGGQGGGQHGGGHPQQGGHDDGKDRHRGGDRR